MLLLDMNLNNLLINIKINSHEKDFYSFDACVGLCINDQL